MFCSCSRIRRPKSVIETAASGVKFRRFCPVPVDSLPQSGYNHTDESVLTDEAVRENSSRRSILIQEDQVNFKVTW